jgi:hypothetical protein
MMTVPQYTVPAPPAGCSWDPSIPTDWHGGYVYPGRHVLQIPGRTWATTPAECPDPGYGDWIAAGGQVVDDLTAPADGQEVLVCPRCGLDIT